MKILGVISSYNPSIGELSENIRSFLDQIDHLIIWENTKKEDSKLEQLKAELDCEKVEIRTTGKNEYLAGPFNQCIQWGYDNGFTHVLTMDQDSRFREGDFKQYKQIVSAHNEMKVAVWGPSSNSRPPVNDALAEVNYTFLSGALIPVSTFIALGGFRNDLVIDALDTEYCLRAAQKGFKTIIVKQIHLQHQLGYREKNKAGLTLVSYSAQRSYYFIRNTLWLWKQFPESYNSVEKKHYIKYRIIYRTLKLVFEKNTFRKFVAIVTAIIHYKANRLGRYDKFY